MTPMMEINMQRTMAPTMQGKMPVNLSGRRKNPVSPSFGMTAPPMKKGGKVHKKKKGGHVHSDEHEDRVLFKKMMKDEHKHKKGGHVKKHAKHAKKHKKGGSVEAACYKKGGHVHHDGMGHDEHMHPMMKKHGGKVKKHKHGGHHKEHHAHGGHVGGGIL